MLVVDAVPTAYCSTRAHVQRLKTRCMSTTIHLNLCLPGAMQESSDRLSQVSASPTVPVAIFRGWTAFVRSDSFSSAAELLALGYGLSQVKYFLGRI